MKSTKEILRDAELIRQKNDKPIEKLRRRARDALNKTADYNAIKEIAKILKVKGEK
jgi:hypothetical protein